MKNIVALILVLMTTAAYAIATRTIDADQIKSADHTKTWTMPNATGTVSCVSCTETLTNKSISGGQITSAVATATALAANPTDCGAGTKATAIDASGNLTCSAVSLTADVSGTLGATSGGTAQSTWAAGDMLYASATNTLSKLAVGSSGQVIKSVGGVPTWATFSGGINYLSSNPDAEADTSGWSTFADGAVSVPVDGTGGASNSTWTRSTSSPLRGSASFLWTKSAGASRQGEGVSYSFTIDAADQGQVLQVSFDYLVASGTFADNDMQVWIYDVTNATMIQPAPTNILNTSVAQRWQGTFQTATNSTSYRLILYVPVTTNSANTVRFDNFEVGPQKKSYGPFISDWTSWTPTGGWSTNATYTGRWRRVGDSLEAYVTVALSGAPTGSATVTLPSGLSIDTSKLPTQLANIAPVFGEATGWDSAPGAAYTGSVGYASSTSVVAVTSSGSGPWNATTPVTWATGDYVAYHFKVPIVGWSSGQLLSSDADTRVVAAQVYGAPTGTIASTLASSTTAVYPSVSADTHGKYSSGSYTVPVSGFYRVTAQAFVTGTISAGQFFAAAIYKNGTLANYNQEQAGGATNQPVASVTATINCVAGDVITIRYASNITSPTFGGDNNNNFFHVERLSGPSQIAASESVNVRASTSAGQSIANGSSYVTVVFGTVGHSSHGASAYDSATGIFTCPISGKYAVKAAALFNTASFTSGTIPSLAVLKNGSSVAQGYTTVFATASNYVPVQVSDTVSCVFGDTIKIGIKHGEGSARSLNADALTNWLAIERVGN